MRQAENPGTEISRVGVATTCVAGTDAYQPAKYVPSRAARAGAGASPEAEKAKAAAAAAAATAAKTRAMRRRRTDRKLTRGKPKRRSAAGQNAGATEHRSPSRAAPQKSESEGQEKGRV